MILVSLKIDQLENHIDLQIHLQPTFSLRKPPATGPITGLQDSC